MSRLRERLRDASRRRPAPLGFAPRDRAGASARRVLVVAAVAGADEAARAAAAGADALLLRAGGEDALAGLAAAIGAASGVPLGVFAPAATAADADALIEAGADFLAFDPDRAEAAALLRPGLGHVAVLPEALAAPDAAADALRLLQPLDLDAILIPPPPEGEPTVRAQLLVRRIADLTGKPLIAPAGAPADAMRLEVWRDAGAPAALAAAAEAGAVAAAADAVPPPRERLDARPDALVPSVAPDDPGGEDDGLPF